MMNKPGDDIIVFKHFDNAIDANIAKTKLDAYDIPCFLTEENMANLIPGQNLYAIKIRLHLFAADREKAAEILTADTLSVYQDAAGVCPRCQSRRITRAFPKKIVDSLTIVFFGIFLPHKKVDQCMDCGFEF
jgi:hypothetical protein